MKKSVSLSWGIYKVPELVRQLIKKGAQVQVVMTSVGPDAVLTLQVLTKRPVLTILLTSGEPSQAQHVAMADWCDSSPSGASHS